MVALRELAVLSLREAEVVVLRDGAAVALREADVAALRDTAVVALRDAVTPFELRPPPRLEPRLAV